MAHDRATNQRARPLCIDTPRARQLERVWHQGTGDQAAPCLGLEPRQAERKRHRIYHFAERRQPFDRRLSRSRFLNGRCPGAGGGVEELWDECGKAERATSGPPQSFHQRPRAFRERPRRSLRGEVCHIHRRRRAGQED
jgi:hypothetical protein